jgi:competence protein ComEA
MRKQIKQFLINFFYFNSNERKGLISLLVLVFLLQGLAFSYQYYAKQQSVPELTMATLDWALDSSYVNSNFKYEPKSTFRHKNFSNSKAFEFKKDSVYPQAKRSLKFPINLNTTDSETLVKLPKIGPFLAGKIIDYRNKLGGFHSLSQLQEIWGFKEDYLYDLEGKIWVDPKHVLKIPINTVGFDHLKTHPYFKFTLSRAIINYRTQHGTYKNSDDLKPIKIMNDSILHLIRPYLLFD